MIYSEVFTYRIDLDYFVFISKISCQAFMAFKQKSAYHKTLSTSPFIIHTFKVSPLKWEKSVNKLSRLLSIIDRIISRNIHFHDFSLN